MGDMEHTNTWKTYSKKQLKECEEFSQDYRNFLDNGKTERECVDTIVNEIEKHGYVEMEKLAAEGKTLTCGDKVYSVWMNKSIVLYQVGERPIEEGMNILGAHIDSPRLDVKQNPLYEDGGFAYLDTHYYGGIKKYQWVALPLALHGVVIKKDGTTILVNIGDKEDDPVLFISDLLVHLSQEQLEKKAAKVIEGEALDLIIGNRPYLEDTDKNKDADKKEKDKDTEKEDAQEKDAVKKSILALLKEYYGMEEEDFISAELEIVPAGKAREAGIDRSMVMAYGQDDRVCAFASYRAMLELSNVKRTACCILVDKEEIGSVGATGMQSKFLKIPSQSSWRSAERIQSLHSAGVLRIVTCFPPTFQARMIRVMRAASIKRMLRFSGTVWCLTNLRVPEGNQVRMMPMRNILHISGIFLSGKRSICRRRSSVRLISAAAEPLPIFWHYTA